MIDEKHCILAFDIEDAKKISNYLKDKKREILAITPNAFEILKNDKFENIITPQEINKNLHEDLAEDNIKFRSKLNNILIDVFRDDTLCKNRIILEIREYQKNI